MMDYIIENKINEFITLIKNINNSDIEETEYLHEPKDIITSIVDIALVLFIHEDGNVNYDNICEVSKHGISIFPLERDRFGWLVGGIETKKGIIAFG
jgi:hypothetical protein